MTTDAHVPYADPEPLADLVEECRCVEAECTAHGVDLHREQRSGNATATGPVVITETVSHLMDGLADYGC